MIAKRILGYPKSADLQTLKNKASLYTWEGNGLEEMDGPTILWILLRAVNPSTRVGISEIKKSLRLAHSSKFKHNVMSLTDHMSSKYRSIIDKGHKHEDYMLDLFDALGTVPHPDFVAHVRDERKAWELGGFKTADTIIAEAVTIYNNKVEAGTWEYKDPKDAKITALTTELESLRKAQTTLTALVTDTAGNSYANKWKKSASGYSFSIEPWRKIKGEASVERNGKQWWWCPHHKMEGEFDGLYVTHQPEKHDEWKQNKEARSERRKQASLAKKEDKSAGDEAAPSDTKTLALSNVLKTALMSHCELTPAQVDALFQEVQDDADF